MFDRGRIVVASDPYGHTPRRPYLLLSDEAHPFAGEQYITAGITTKEYPPSIPLEGRATNVYRKENGQWKVVHHHAEFAELIANMG